ncbi:hypothetical protein [Mesorhizobium sp. CO1-1-9]|uniref:hypothetical protein n=1 Tax=Mesorhizobium sp. CO1-1-9 TaxID=2876630 RepID=UPI001CCE3961|nr:hypothetical protein [Mesorhizobium sp. CO1-1-9]MBZ9698816.1 hypothetical protein [Mesorhizobium sp. CO1-1-9]
MKSLESASADGRVAANDDTPVFDAANRKLQTEFEVDTTIPTGKAAARAELHRLMSAAPAITCCRYNPPRGPKAWKPGKYAAANDNESNPLLEALRRDGRESDIPLILRYRLLVEVVGTSPFDDEIDMSEEGMSVQARSLQLCGKAFERSFNGMSATKLPGGDISYREQRHTVKQIVSVGQRTNAADDDGARTQAPLRLAKSEDERIARIDGRPILAALRAVLGDLVHIFEDVAIGNGTLTWIGERVGFKHKARSREGKVAVYTAIDRLRDQWRLIDRQMAAQEAACDRRVETRRAELAAVRAAFLGLAA